MRDASPAPPQSPHALAFRVMRLTTPLPSTTNPLPFQPENVDIIDTPPVWQAEGAACGIGSLSVLPSSFGSIYASETFTSFISVCNRSQHLIPRVTLSITMQTPTHRRIPLFQSPASKPLAQRATINHVVDLPLPELGVHVLVCVANYVDANAANRTLKQYFRFNVLAPLEPQIAVRPVYTALDPLPNSTTSEERPQQFLVHVRLLNSLPLNVFDTVATFEPLPPFQVSSMDKPPPEESTPPHWKNPRRATMGLSDTRNFIFHLYCRSSTNSNSNAPSLADSLWSGTPPPNKVLVDVSDHPLKPKDSELNPPQSPSSTRGAQLQLGKVTISWRSALGEKGSLQKAVTVFQPIEARNDVDVSIQATPQTILTHHPFMARCAARNNKNHPVRLYLQVRRDLVGEIVPVGVSGVSLGEVQPGRTAWCAVTLVALVRGQHTISGVRVVDIDSQQIFKADAPTIFVS